MAGWLLASRAHRKRSFRAEATLNTPSLLYRAAGQVIRPRWLPSIPSRPTRQKLAPSTGKSISASDCLPPPHGTVAPTSILLTATHHSRTRPHYPGLDDGNLEQLRLLLLFTRRILRGLGSGSDRARQRVRQHRRRMRAIIREFDRRFYGSIRPQGQQQG
jgi:hypothetical protein